MSDSSLQMQTAVVGDAEYTYMNILLVMTVWRVTLSTQIKPPPLQDHKITAPKATRKRKVMRIEI